MFEIVAEHGWVFLTCAVLVFEVQLTAFLVGKARREAFNKDFLDKHFGEDHFKAFSLQVADGGYPDMGCGRYASKLEYKDCVLFNNAQRAHLNFVENITVYVVLLLCAGLYYPIEASILGWIIILGRVGYAFYFTEQGASHKLRKIGSALSGLASLVLFVYAIISSVNLINSDDVDEPLVENIEA